MTRQPCAASAHPRAFATAGQGRCGLQRSLAAWLWDPVLSVQTNAVLNAGFAIRKNHASGSTNWEHAAVEQVRGIKGSELPRRRPWNRQQAHAERLIEPVGHGSHIQQQRRCGVQQRLSLGFCLLQGGSTHGHRVEAASAHSCTRRGQVMAPELQVAVLHNSYVGFQHLSSAGGCRV